MKILKNRCYNGGAQHCIKQFIEEKRPNNLSDAFGTDSGKIKCSHNTMELVLRKNSVIPNMKRRTFLSTIGGITLPSLLQAQYGKNVKAKNIIYVYLPGGISAQETFDPKPLADSEFKGPFGAIKTKTDDLLFSENFSKLAQQTDKFTVIHSMTHGQAAHERGSEYMFTGYKPSPALRYASLGSVISHEKGIRNSLPAYVTVPTNPNEFSGSGFLSRKFSPFALGSDPASKDFKVRDLADGITNRKRDILELVDSNFKNRIEDDGVKAMDEFYSQAFDLMASQKAREAFDLSKESEKIKDKYGRGQAGQRLLISRRLVESGVRIVKTVFGSWDNHDNIKSSFDRQAAELDKALSYLFEDLKERGMLDETLVVVTSEFGRTPKVNKTSGRDHYPKVFSTIVGGGGIKNGNVIGSSGSLSMEVESSPVAPEDLFATIFHLSGISPEKELMTPDLRPIKVSRGNVINQLL